MSSVRQGFPGIAGFFKLVERKLYEDARRKFGTNYGSTTKIARALAITDGVVSRTFASFGMVRSGRKEQPRKERSPVA